MLNVRGAMNCATTNAFLLMRTYYSEMVLYQINLIRSFPIKSALRGGPRDLALQIGLIGYYTGFFEKMVVFLVCCNFYDNILSVKKIGNSVVFMALLCKEILEKEKRH